MTSPPQTREVGELVIFLINQQKFGLPVSVVERVVQVPEIATLPNLPNSILGVVNVEGALIPVYNLRQRLNIVQREVSLDDHLLIAKTSRRRLALLVDGVSEVVHYSSPLVEPGEVVPGLETIQGIAKLNGDIVFIYDLERALSRSEEEALDAALRS